MTPEMGLSNVFATVLQGIALTLAGGGLLMLRGIAPRLRLLWAQALLVACLALPLAAPWKRPQKVDLSRFQSAKVETGTGGSVSISAPADFPWQAIVLGLMAAGVVGRLAWLGLGCWRLSRYAAASEPWPDNDELARAMSLAGVSADVGMTAEVRGPVTFGWLAPVVLLPPGLAVLSSGAREAVLYHELLHVKRRDWAGVLVEEMVRALFWFHPAVWWLLAQVHLCREQIVDALVVNRTGRREEYLDALISVARSHLGSDLAPAPLFLKASHLASRVDWLIQESTMSLRKTLSTAVVLAALVLVTGRLAVEAFPLQAPSYPEPSSPGVSTDAGPIKLLHSTPPAYPLEALEKNVQGDVVLDLTIDSSGKVVDARVVSGPEELRKAALMSALQWHYDTRSATTTRATISFKPSEDLMKVAGLMKSRPSTAVSSSAAGSNVIRRIDIAAPASVRDQMQAKIRLQPGDTLTDAALDELQAAAKSIDEHLRVATRRGPEGLSLMVFLAAPEASMTGVVGGVTRGVLGGIVGGVPSTGSSTGVSGGVVGGIVGAVPSADMPKQIRVGGNVQQAKLVKQEKPMYPPLAKQARVQGTVRLNVVLAADGTVKGIEVQSGHPLLVPSAVDSVRQWQYQTTLLNGIPVEVVTTVDVNFTLADEPPAQ